MMLDSAWRGGGPHTSLDIAYTAPDRQDHWQGVGYEMSHFVIPRHGRGYVNTIFVDLSAGSLPLKELWGLKWHRDYNTRTIPTNAWPDWMEQYD
jgi:hypothetical protein